MGTRKPRENERARVSCRRELLPGTDCVPWKAGLPKRQREQSALRQPVHIFREERRRLAGGRAGKAAPLAADPASLLLPFFLPSPGRPRRPRLKPNTGSPRRPPPDLPLLPSFLPSERDASPGASRAAFVPARPTLGPKVVPTRPVKRARGGRGHITAFRVWKSGSGEGGGKGVPPECGRGGSWRVLGRGRRGRRAAA